jgi:hypothetical protein
VRLVSQIRFAKKRIANLFLGRENGQLDQLRHLGTNGQSVSHNAKQYLSFISTLLCIVQMNNQSCRHQPEKEGQNMNRRGDERRGEERRGEERRGEERRGEDVL